MLINRQLWLHILTGMAAGAVTGILLSPSGLALINAQAATTIGSWLGILGIIFLGLISMVIIPLVVCSIILGINGSRDMGFVKRISVRLIPYFLITSLITVMIGIGMATLLEPGKGMTPQSVGISMERAEQAAEAKIAGRSLETLTIPQRIANIIPSNPLRAAMEVDLLKVVVGAILAALAILALPRQTTATLVDLCNAGQAVSMKIIEWVMRIAPYAVFGMITDMVIRLGPSTFIGLWWYVATVLIGLFLIFLMYLLIVACLARRSPLEFLKATKAVQLLAFSTSSSAAVMPVTLQTTEEKLGVHPDTARFVVPLGTTINMDGTGMYQAAAAVFLCQFFGIDLSFGEMMILAFTMVGASIGTPSTPGVGIVVLSTVVSGMGVPPEGIGMILGVDRFLDMCRTSINVMGDTTASVVMHRWLHKDGKQPPLAPSLSTTGI